jgi:glycine/D-amino acid oxidase-like deaminating enzyme
MRDGDIAAGCRDQQYGQMEPKETAMRMRVAICGGGVIGACTAYYLSRREVDVTVIEAAGVANAASGKAGGFLAYDWCAGSSLDALARRSFTLHAQLPGEVGHEIDGDWDYRRMDAYGGFILPYEDAPRQSRQRLPWLSERVVISSHLGTPDTTAIVHPGKFTMAMMRAAEKHGTRVVSARITGLMSGADGSTIRGVEIEGGFIEADAVLIAMGPWSILAAQWLKLPKVWAEKSNSLIYDTGDAVPAEALFLEYTTEARQTVTVEVFPRVGQTYVTAFGSSSPLPVNPADVSPEPELLEQIKQVAAMVSPVLDPSRIVAHQACYRPIVQDGLPLIGKIPQTENACVATGHNVWGILNAPATGEAMADLIVDGAARNLDLTAFEPIRLPPLDPASLRIA